MSPACTVHVRVEGRVQARSAIALGAENTARALDLTGWVRNRRDRSVEMVLQGPPERVEDMLRRCERGPPDARVTKVEVLGVKASAPTMASRRRRRREPRRQSFGGALSVIGDTHAREAFFSKTLRVRATPQDELRSATYSLT